VALDELKLLREVIEAVIDDTVRQIPLLADAIRDGNASRVRRLARYSKGACANVGAHAAAATLEQIERQAACSEFAECSARLSRLAADMERLRLEALPAA
jgi:HPt (histidine-containing phosphotransfer) domain-containing protein